MKNRISKYRKYMTATFLASYVFFIGLTIVHYHHINIQNGNYKLLANNSSSKNLFDGLVDVTHECTVQQIANTILDFNFTADFNIIKEKSDFDILNNEIVKLPSNILDSSNPHRAPPISTTLFNQI